MFYGLSFNEVMRKLRDALSSPDDPYRYYIRELYETYAIIEEERTSKLYKVAFSVSEAGDVTPGTMMPVEVEYIQTVNSVKVALKSDGSIPSEIQLIPYGRHDTAKGPFVLDDEGASLIMAAFDEQENDLVIDYEHQTLFGGQAPAAGWIKKLTNKGQEGIWGVVDWTPQAAKYLKNREYRYLSPVFLKTLSEGRVVKLINAALTNAPAIDGMVPLVNKQTMYKEGRMKFFQMVLKLLGLPDGTTEEQAMEALKGLQGTLAVHKDVLTELGLKPEATAEEVKTAVAAMKAEPGKGVVVVAAKEVLDALELKEGASLSEVTGTIMAMKQSSGEAGKLAAEVAALKARLDTSDAETLVMQAMKDGKVTPATRAWALDYAKRDPEGFKVFAAKAPRLVVEGEVVTGVAPAEVGARTNDVQASVNKALGIDEEKYKKYGPQEQQQAQ